MTISAAEHAGTKRPHSSSTSDERNPLKKRKVHHYLRNVQERSTHMEPAPQDPIFAQGQLLKSIAAALVVAGFDAVKPTALEMFRSHVEEYVLKLLSHARLSMHDSRRTTPTALDFASALSQTPNAHTASLLKSQLDLSLPKDIAYPSIPEPAPAPPPAPDFSGLLKPLMDARPPTYIPRHFPALPPRHAWKQTEVFAQRERDARKMRETATEEGMLAEQALRKLAAAAKSGAVEAEKKRSTVVNGSGKVKNGRHRDSRAGVISMNSTYDDAFKDIVGSEEIAEEIGEMEAHGAKEKKVNGLANGMSEGVEVNHYMAHWRGGSRAGHG